MIGKEPFGLIVGSTHVDFVREVFKQLSLGQMSGPSFGENITKSGRRFLSEWTDTRLVDAELAAIPLADDPAAPGSLLVLRDVSAREARERELRQKQKLEIVGQLAGGVAHDFNNVLTVVLSACSLLSRGRLDAKAHDEVELIRGAAESAAALTRQLLTFARRRNVETRLFDLNELVMSAERLLHRVLGEDIELLVSANRPVWAVRADPRQIEQVIFNLASNARAAMPQGGRLTIATANAELRAEAARHELGEAPGSYVVLRVSDTGAGMDGATMARVFEPFFTTKEAGAGLGLATCYGIVTQCGGRIGVESAPGSGSTFSVYLPAAKEGDVEVPVPKPRPGLTPERNPCSWSTTTRPCEASPRASWKAPATACCAPAAPVKRSRPRETSRASCTS
jgi:two-component system, cell cycle sensor histidine kinase and response regulator CckA